MGQPPLETVDRPAWQAEGTGGTETSHVPRGKERIPVVAASEPGRAQTRSASEAAAAADVGLYAMTGGPSRVLAMTQNLSRAVLEQRTEEGESPVGDGVLGWCVMSVSTAGHAKSGGKQGRPRPKAKYPRRPIVHQYREGTVKSTPSRGVKQNLKPCASGRSEPL